MIAIAKYLGKRDNIPTERFCLRFSLHSYYKIGIAKMGTGPFCLRRRTRQWEWLHLLPIEQIVATSRSQSLSGTGPLLIRTLDFHCAANT